MKLQDNNYHDDYWPHAPAHRLSQSGSYFVTTGTYKKQQHFRSPERLAVLQRGLLKICHKYNWQLEAWAVFSNHYHFVAHSPEDKDNAESLGIMLGELHARTANWINKRDQNPGRQVWHNFRETKLSFQKSYLARLNYTHQNPVKHGLVPKAALYPYCSASWFEQTAHPADVHRIYTMKIDTVNVMDDYEPKFDW